MKNIFWVILSIFLLGCGLIVPNVKKEHNKTEASLEWFIWWENGQISQRLKEDYRHKIDQYLSKHPKITPILADKMRNCIVAVGMSREQVLAILQPHYILSGESRNEVIFKYSDVGKFKWGEFYSSGEKLWVNFRNDKVYKIDRLSSSFGF